MDGSNRRSVSESISRLVARLVGRFGDGMATWVMDGWMDGGVLIRYLGKWMTFRRPLGLGFQGGVRCGGVRVR